MFDTLKDILVTEMDVKEEDIRPDAQLSADLGLNSLELPTWSFSARTGSALP